MKRTTFLVTFACAVLTLSLLGCGTTKKLQSVQLSTSNKAESAMGTLELKGVGGTLQLYLWGNYSNGSQKLLSNVPVTYQIVLTPGSAASTGILGDPNATPPQTVQLSTNGLLTAVPPFACSFVNLAVPPATTPSWALSGTYAVTGTFQGHTSPAAFVAMASEAGIADTTNPTGACGP